jgi:hypothetical protein
MVMLQGGDEEFAIALGVQVEEVGDMDGECFLWDPDTQTATVCASLCRSRRELGFKSLLETL